MTKDPFGTTREDRGTWLLVPIGLVTVLASFAALAVLARIRLSIGGRRDALVSALPRIVNPTHSSHRSEI